MFSQFTREFWTKCVKEDGHRPDGRELLEYRNIGLNTGTLGHCNGSAVVKLGSCVVVCGVKCELLTPVQKIGKPKLTVFTAYHHDHTINTLYTEHLNATYQQSSVINTEQLQIVADKLFWVLYIDCVSLSPSVSLDACFLATTAALQNAQLPKVVVNDDGIPTVSSYEKHCIVLTSFPLVVTMASINHEIIVDPSYEELKICESMVHIISNGFSQLDNIKIEGSIGNEGDIKRCLQEAPKMLLTLETLLNSVCFSR